MDYNKIYFLNLLKAFIQQEKPPIPKENINWADILGLSQMHQITGMIYYVVKNLDDEYKPPEPILLSMKNIFMQNIFRDVQLSEDLSEINKEFENKKIPHIFIKGYILKHYYPVQELRTMGDIDILVKKEDRERAYDVMVRLGYKPTFDGDEVWNYLRGMTYIEAHTNIIYQSIKENVNYIEYFSYAWENSVPMDIEYSYELKKEYHFLYILVHIAKHFHNCGCGIRMIMDVAVFVNKFMNILDWNYIWCELDKLDLVLFTKNILSLCNKWFDVKLSKDTYMLEEKFYQNLCNYVIDGGTYGYFGEYNREAAILRREYSKGEKDYKKSVVNVFKETIFPSYKEMMSLPYCSFVKNKPYLLPVGWIYRFYYRTFKEKNGTYQRLYNMSISQEVSDKQYEVISKLGI